AKAWELMAWVPWFRCRAGEAEEALKRAIEHARHAGDRRTEAQSLHFLVGTAFFGPKPLDAAISLCEEILEEPAQQRRVVASALLAQALHLQGRADEALRLSESSREAAAPDDLIAHVQWRTARAKALARTGETQEAEMLAREAVALAEETDFLVTHGDALADLAQVLRAAGRPEEAVPILRAALALYEQKGSIVSVAAARAAL